MDLSKEKYYHGLLPREDIKALLRNTGDYIVRMSEPSQGQPRQYILSICNDQVREDVKHFVMNRTHDQKFFLDSYSFDSVQALIIHYASTQEPVSKHQPTCILRNPVGRQKWELEHEDITPTKKLGEGAFGEVSLGVWRKKGREVKVAIKLAKLDTLTKEQIKEIMREARLMRMFDCPYVVRLYGVAAAAEPLMLVMELASDGALNSYLEKNLLEEHKKSEMCLQASWGIEYLHTKNIIHRDIAARNCLYGDGKVKISDFGMSREGPIYQMDPSRRVPIRWLSPETMRVQIYSPKSDAYSFGIMCWEIYHNGKEPFPGMNPGEVHRYVLEGNKMEFEQPINHEIRAIIVNQLWTDNTNERLSMEHVSRKFEMILGIKKPDWEEEKRKRKAEDTSRSSADPKLRQSASSGPIVSGGSSGSGSGASSAPSRGSKAAKPQAPPAAGEGHNTTRRNKGTKKRSNA